MTEIEAIAVLKHPSEHITYDEREPDVIFSGSHVKALEMAVAALTEQAERSTGCEVCNGCLPCDNGCDGFCDICDVPEVWKTIHKTGHYNYCPMCGRKLPKKEADHATD